MDFSEASRSTLHAAVRVAREFKGNLHVLFVEDPLLASAAAISPAVSTDLKEELKQFVAATPDLDPPADPILHVTQGQSADESDSSLRWSFSPRRSSHCLTRDAGGCLSA